MSGNNEILEHRIFSLLLLLIGVLLFLFLGLSRMTYVADAKITERQMIVDRDDFPDGSVKVKDVKRYIHYEFYARNGELKKGKKHVPHWAWMKYKEVDRIEILDNPFGFAYSLPTGFGYVQFLFGCIFIVFGVRTWGRG